MDRTLHVPNWLLDDDQLFALWKAVREVMKEAPDSDNTQLHALLAAIVRELEWRGASTDLVL